MKNMDDSRKGAKSAKLRSMGRALSLRSWGLGASNVVVVVLSNT